MFTIVPILYIVLSEAVFVQSVRVSDTIKQSFEGHFERDFVRGVRCILLEKSEVGAGGVRGIFYSSLEVGRGNFS